MPTKIENISANLNLMSLNIQSLRAKFDSFSATLEHFTEKKIFLDIIALQETWLDSIDYDLQLAGFQSYHTVRSASL